AMRTANVEYLRIVVERDPAFGPQRDSAIAAGREALAELERVDEPQATGWRQARTLFNQWVQETQASLTAAAGADPQEALTQRRTAAETRVLVENQISDLVLSLQQAVNDEIDVAQRTSDASRL